MSDFIKSWAKRFQYQLDNEKLQIQETNLSVRWPISQLQLDYKLHKVHLILTAHDRLWELF
jgi:hypothetical protein